jgi:hypothetical protein
MGKWISVKDEEPPLYEPVALIIDGSPYMGSCFQTDDPNVREILCSIDGFDEAIDLNDNEITHWMQLPELPKK